ncbi:flippase activity-associated protein Agl23 [Natronomonas marina]|uniref:flippase activity-associated protein Agl23 n=1 Tax=Natronomonas marina TaxID=2961939 RepID=UPI0020C9E754|nr:flippase activity-associated protein Agl23 [Natronomonas marina]
MNRGDRTVRAVVAITVLALVARFVLLGSRVAHFDEARVAWWGLDYLETGATSYRYIIHGPLMQHLHAALFAVFGASDFVMRAPVALVGGLLPLVALWFRQHLDDVEVVALAVFLAVDPILLYYSRFARSTVFVAAFCFVAFAALVRWYDGDGHGYLLVAASFLALGFGAKENAVVYVLCWFGATGLLLAGSRVGLAPPVGARTTLGEWVEARRERYRRDPAKRRLYAAGAYLLGAAAVAVAVVVFLYAPRGGDAGLWTGNLGATFDTMWTDIRTGMEYWFGQGEEKDLAAYRSNLERFVSTSVEYAGALVVLSVAGFLAELTRREEARKLVLGCSYWGFASVVGYPLGTDIWGAWIIVNALVPLSVPAAVGLGTLIEVGREALADADRISAGIVGVLLVLVVGQVAVVGASAAFVQPTSPDNDLVQFAQPQQEMRQPVDEIAAVAATHESGPDVLVYGSDDFVGDGGFRSPECIRWTRTLPLAWYLEGPGASVTCAGSADAVPEELPPVVVAEADCTLDRTVECRREAGRLAVDDDLRERIPDDYERYGFLHRTTGGSSFDGMVVFVDRDARAAQSVPASAFRSHRGPARRYSAMPATPDSAA